MCGAFDETALSLRFTKNHKQYLPGTKHKYSSKVQYIVSSTSLNNAEPDYEFNLLPELEVSSADDSSITHFFGKQKYSSARRTF